MTVHRPDHLPVPETDEAFVREVLDSAMARTRPPYDLSTAALVRGRRLRIRRRIGITGAIVAASAVAAVAVPWAWGADDSRTTDASRIVATDPPAPRPQDLPGWWDMPATEMVSTVEAILPDEVTVTAPGPLEADTPEGGPAAGWINAHLAAPAGPGRLNVMLYRDPYSFVVATDPTMPLGDGSNPSSSQGPVEITPDSEPDRTSCDEAFSGRTECVQIRDESGTVVGRRLTNRWGGTVVNEVVLARDGGIVYAASANTIEEKWDAGSPTTAPRPPMTLDELEALVRNDAWVSYRP
ncbi:hypothetical protein EUA93_13195 [Nocardioides oleivorans]|uniref:Uncharacterized protein n=1 Tax=Nocardioides oleivorans TaxID=273676 RepID=A0A4Q2S0R2_9ACTN|nr:hypothetical protein [Nocardioides oleivorans]RYB95210.1 hypothetical protein EUA93_13195 [Nocardioides oleivorans]